MLWGEVGMEGASTPTKTNELILNPREEHSRLPAVPGTLREPSAGRRGEERSFPRLTQRPHKVGTGDSSEGRPPQTY